MNIALDFDGTYTEDTHLWNRFIKDSQNRNHKVFLVTFRAPEHEALNQDAFDYLKQLNVPLIFTNRIPKRKFTESMGLKIDIWIDDNPDLIIKASEWSMEDYDLWAKEEAKRVEELMKASKKTKKKKEETKEECLARWVKEYISEGNNINMASALAEHRWAAQQVKSYPWGTASIQSNWIDTPTVQGAGESVVEVEEVDNGF